MRFRLGFAAALFLSSTPAFAQFIQPRPVAAEREIVAVFITNATCCLAINPMMHDAIESIHSRLKSEAIGEGATFRMVGVSIDGDRGIGRDYLKGVGSFDEVSVDGNWETFEDPAFVWKYGAVEHTIPQVVVYEHSRTSAVDEFGPARVIKIVKGTKDIPAWARSEAPLLR